MPPNKPSVKARLARAFLNFLDEHGDYRTQLEEAAARAAAAEANSLLKQQRGLWGRKRKKRRKSKDGDDEDDGLGEEEEEEYEGLPDPDDSEKNRRKNQLPEDPYEQIQFYFHTFTHRTSQQIQERVDTFKLRAREVMHDELHHDVRVPALSGGMLLVTLALWAWRARSKRMGKIARVHGILGKKLTLGEYLHPNVLRGRILLKLSREGDETLGKMREKASKAEEAALASMRPYQRRKYERLSRLEGLWEKCVALCLILGMLTSGCTLALSLEGLIREIRNVGGDDGNATQFELYGLDEGEGEEERLDGHIYSLDGPTDSDGYPLGMRELAEENYASCLSQAEEGGVENPSTGCDLDSFFDAVSSKDHRSGGNNEAGEGEEEEVPSSPLRDRINVILTSHLKFPPPLATYLTTLHRQTISYLSSLFAFLLFLSSHWVAHKLHVMTMRNDPMKHFVLTATDNTVKADGTVAAKRGETEGQRKRRERMLKSERLKAQMAQLAMEAKQRVEERRKRMEAAEGKDREEEERKRREAKEGEELMRAHSRQFMMIKAGVPEGAIMNSLIAEGFDEEEERREILVKLMAVKARRAEDARREEEMELKKMEEEKEEEEEKERVAAERLRMMKKNSHGSKSSSFGSGAQNNQSSRNKAAVPKTQQSKVGSSVVVPPSNSSVDGVAGGASIASASTITTAATTDPLLAKSAMLSQIKIKKKPSAADAKSAMLGQISQGGGLNKKNTQPSAADAKSAMLGQISQGGSTKTSSSMRKTPTSPSSTPKGGVGTSTTTTTTTTTGSTPKKSNISSRDDNNAQSSSSTEVVRRIPSSLKLGGEPSSSLSSGGGGGVLSMNNGVEEEKKGEEEPDGTSSTISPRPAGRTETPASAAAAARPAAIKKQVSENDGGGNDDNHGSSPPPVLVRVSSSPDTTTEVLQQQTTTASPSAWGRRMSVGDIRATITAVENAPDEEPEAGQENGNADNEGNNDDDDGTSNDNTVVDGVDLAPSWLHSPAFEMALRNSNSSWDRRPSSRDVGALTKARIQAVEMAQEGTVGESRQRAVVEEEDHANSALDASARSRQRSQTNPQQQQDSLAIIDEGRKIEQPKIEPATSFEFRRKASKNNASANGGGETDDDDEISELSEPTIHSLQDSAFRGRSIPRALFVPQKDTSPAALSPMVSSVSLAGRKSLTTKDNMERIARLRGDFPVVPATVNDGALKTNDASVIKSEEVIASKVIASEVIASEEEAVVPETEEQIRRREKAEARAKKMEAIAARREAGKEDDDRSAVSGISKRHRMRRKKKKQQQQQQQELAIIQQEEATSVKSSDAVSQRSDDVSSGGPKPETEEEKVRRRRAEARAKKIEAMAARREADWKDDGTVVSGISKRHRVRRKRSALAANAIGPEEQLRIDWKDGVYSSALNAERARWRRTVHARVLDAEAVREANAEAGRELEEKDAEARRLLEHQKKLDKRARKFAARSQRFHSMRRKGNDGDDDKSVVSSASRMRRRRGRKGTTSSSGSQSIAVQSDRHRQQLPLTEETTSSVPTVPSSRVTTREESERREREEWRDHVYSTALRADRNRWKRKAYAHVLDAERARTDRREMEARIAGERAAADARWAKERKGERRAKKMERMRSSRGGSYMHEGGNGGENFEGGNRPEDDDVSVATASVSAALGGGGGSSLKKMRSRRRKAAMKKASNNV